MLSFKKMGPEEPEKTHLKFMFLTNTKKFHFFYNKNGEMLGI